MRARSRSTWRARRYSRRHTEKAHTPLQPSRPETRAERLACLTPPRFYVGLGRRRRASSRWAAPLRQLRVIPTSEKGPSQSHGCEYRGHHCKIVICETGHSRNCAGTGKDACLTDLCWGQARSERPSSVRTAMPETRNSWARVPSGEARSRPECANTKSAAACYKMSSSRPDCTNTK